MNSKVIDGKKIAAGILEETKSLISDSLSKPKLSIVLASDDLASKTYVNLKKKKAESIGITVDIHNFDLESNPADLILQIDELNKDTNVTGVLIQVPFFNHLRTHTNQIINSLYFKKDVDGLTATQQGLVAQFIHGSIPPAAVEAILESINETTEENVSWKNILNNYETIEFFKSKLVVILNNSNLVGKPLSQILTSLGATVIITNTLTKNVNKYIKEADIVVSATGKTNIIDSAGVKENSILIDVTSEKVGNEIFGDFIKDEKIFNKASAITPVPGGVGPLTIACLLRNLAEVHLKNNQINLH